MPFCLACRRRLQIPPASVKYLSGVDARGPLLPLAVVDSRVDKEMLSQLNGVLTNLGPQEKPQGLASATCKALSLFLARGKRAELGLSALT